MSFMVDITTEFSNDDDFNDTIAREAHELFKALLLALLTFVKTFPHSQTKRKDAHTLLTSIEKTWTLHKNEYRILKNFLKTQNITFLNKKLWTDLLNELLTQNRRVISERNTLHQRSISKRERINPEQKKIFILAYCVERIIPALELMKCEMTDDL